MLERIRALFKKPDPPAPEVDHPAFGKLHWSEDEEGWTGNYRGRRFSIFRDGASTPDEMLCDFALDAMDDSEWLDTTLSRAKQDALETYAASYEDEIHGLTLGTLCFYARDRQARITADLEGGSEYRCWRIEYAGRECEGIGFDD